MGPQHERTQLSDREQRVVHELEARMAMEDPAMAERLSGQRTKPRSLPSLPPRYAAVTVALGAVVMVASFTFSVALAFAGALLVMVATLSGAAGLDRSSR